MEIREFEIPVPWGHVAVKAWGNEADTPVLVVHGLSDNASSFDRLIPYLPSTFYYICIDLPCHGKSSPYPPYLFVSSLDNLFTIKLIMNYLNRGKYVLMGHSWGGQTLAMCAQIYPEHAIKLIALDSFYVNPCSGPHFKDFLIDKFDTLIRVNENLTKKQPPVYSYKEAVEKIREGRMGGNLYKESAEAMLSRSLIPVGEDKFRFSTDPRLRAYLNPIYDLQFVEKNIMIHPIKCPVLFLYASKSVAQYYFFRKFVRELQKRNKKCFLKKVEGSHDVHNNNPDIVGPIVTRFLLDIQPKL